MSDDNSQRPYRSSDSVARSAPGKSAPGAGSASDPLAELARLIGQNDPFAEYGRDGTRAPAAPLPAASDPRLAVGNPNAPAPDYYAAPQAPPLPDMQPFNPPNFARQSFGSPPLGAGPDVYQVEGNVPDYAAAAQDGGYEDAAYDPNKPQLGPEEGDYYEDVPSARRRMGIMVIAGVFALAVIGTAGAFGYRALFGSSGSAAQPPVIKADATPSKIVPASSRDAQSSKQITDRVNERGMGEKLVSREEHPIEIKDKPAGVVFPPAQDQSGSSTPSLGSGIVSPDAKRVRTIAIRPDQATLAEATPTAAPTAPAPPSRVTSVTPTRPAAPAPQPPRVASNAPPAADPEPAPVRRPAVTRAAPAAAPAASNAPLSLSPDAPTRAAPARAAAPTARTAAVAVAPAASGASGGGSYAVQISSQRSEAEAQAAFRGLQGKYPSQLGGKQPLIHKVDLGAKGIYYRAMVGPFATGGEASQLCSSLKAAGGQCLVQRN